MRPDSREPRSREPRSREPELDWERTLDELRRSAEISIDARGRWWQRDVPFEHPRIIAALNRGLSWSSTPQEQVDYSSEDTRAHTEDGEDTPLLEWRGEARVTLGQQWCYISCDVTPFLGLKLSVTQSVDQPSALTLTLNNGERWPLGPLALVDDILWSRLAPDRLARFSPDAQLQVGEWLVELDTGALALEFQGRHWSIHSTLS